MYRDKREWGGKATVGRQMRSGTMMLSKAPRISAKEGAADREGTSHSTRVLANDTQPPLLNTAAGYTGTIDT